jgi:replicative DNA helicase
VRRCTLDDVISPIEAVEAFFAARLQHAPFRSTTFSAIDHAANGFLPGRVWLITGTPGQGRSTLATQWALSLATRHGMCTELVSAKDPEHAIAARLLASVGKIPVSHLWAARTSTEDEAKLRRAQEVLANASLRIAGPSRTSVLSFDPSDTEVPDALVVDDADLEAGARPERLAGLAATGVLVVATLPMHHVIDRDGIAPAWARVADHVLQIDRPDLLDANSLRPGEADLRLLRNRWGPQLTDTVAFQGHYARFVDMAPPPTGADRAAPDWT